MMHFFCTAGRGTEDFLVEELKGIGCHDKIGKTDGKIFFTADGRNTSLLDLKCAERLFIQVLHLPNQRFSNKKDIQRLGKLIADYDLWETVVDCYRALAPRGKDQNDEKCQEPPSKKPRPDTCEDTSDSPITFRISCKLSSVAGRQLEPQAVSRAIGWHVRQALKWQVDTRQPMLEVCVHIGGQAVTVGIPVTSKPLSQRSYLQDFGLRSTVAWIMGKLANIKPGTVVLDPMCGAGTILVEAQHSWPEAQYIGVDMCPNQLQRAWQNVEFSGKRASCPIELLIGNSEYLPIKSNSVDSVICDLPFGNKYLTANEVRKLFPSVLQEFNRVLRPGGNVVLLISTALKEDLLQQVAALTPAIHQGALNASGQVAPPAASSLQGPCSDSHTKPSVHPTETAGDFNEIADKSTGTVSTAINTIHSNSSVLKSGKDTDIFLSEGPSEQCERQIQNSTTSTQAWSVDQVHYLKLGETHSQLCVFTKLHL